MRSENGKDIMVAHTPHSVCVSNTQIDNDIDIYIDRHFWKGVSDKKECVRNSENSCSFSKASAFYWQNIHVMVVCFCFSQCVLMPSGIRTMAAN